MNCIKTVVVFCCVLFSIIACERDFENIGVNIVDNNVFNTSYEDFDVVANTVNVDSSRVDNLPLRNLGVLKDGNFGKLEASIITQLSISDTDGFGLNPVIDTVILDIPYFSTKDSETTSDGKPIFTLDSIFGNENVDYRLKVSRLKTFLNSLDPSDPSRRKQYYSDEEITSFSDQVFFYDSFKPEKNDTVLYVKRHLFEGEESIDTIKNENAAPSLKLPLDENLVRNIFINTATENDFASFENFSNFFRGIKIDAEEIGMDGGSLMTLQTSNAAIIIYYTNEVLTDETDTDLNGNGTTNDTDVPVKTKQTTRLAFSGVSTSLYNRYYEGSLVNDFTDKNFVEGASKAFVQGAAGSNVRLKLFTDESLSIEELRSKNWLINGAVLDFYIENTDAGTLPNQLYLYKEDNTIIEDVLNEIDNGGIVGTLRRDDDGEPEKYTFLITDYISNLLASDSALENKDLILKTYHTTDAVQSLTDTIVRNFSWDVRGVVLTGNAFGEGEPNYGKRMKLRIYYTEDTN